MNVPTLNYRLADRKVDRICIIKPSAFGDVVQSLPLLPALRARFPDSTIDWVINRELTELVSGHPCLNELIPFERHGGISSWISLLERLRARKFDLVFDLQGLARTAVMTWASGAPYRIGLKTAREWSHLSCHWLIPDSGPLVPAHRRYWRIAEELGMEDMSRQIQFHIPEESWKWANQLHSQTTSPILLVHPGARWESKKWPARSFAEVICRTLKEFQMTVYIIGGQSEVASATEIVSHVRHLLPRAQIESLAGKTTIKQLAALMKLSSLTISNDSGPMHLADGLGMPVVGIFTCTSPERSGPSIGPYRTVSTQLSCAASYCKTCPMQGKDQMACMHELRPERVYVAIRNLLSELTYARKAA